MTQVTNQKVMQQPDGGPPGMTKAAGKVETLEQIITNLEASHAVSTRMRAIFGLKALRTSAAIAALETCLRSDPSALVRHEVAYVLGQMQANAAAPTLCDVLCDETEDVMVRHEAGEALGAIGNTAALPLLSRYAGDASVAREIRETCQLAVAKLSQPAAPPGMHPFNTVDPAAPAEHGCSTTALRECLTDETSPLGARYGALFALRNRGDEDAVRALADALEADRCSALLRHEVAYVLGQLASPVAVPALARVLRRPDESPMVRHEAAEALGAVGSPDADAVLEEFRTDTADVVRESVEVALDISDHVTSDNMHYADTFANRPN